MFGENEDLVLENTENAEEQAAEETVEENFEESEKNEQESSESETQEEQEELIPISKVNARVDELVAKKIARREAKIKKEYDKKYSKIEHVLTAGTGVDNLDTIANDFQEFYTKKGIKIPENAHSYDERELKVLAKDDAQIIIDAGYDDVVEELSRLVSLGVDNMTPREKLVFTHLDEYKNSTDRKQALEKIGVKDEVMNSESFKNFASQFNLTTPITKIYELYEKTQDKETVTPMGSMKNDSGKEEKTYYSPEDVDKLTEKDYKDPKIFNNVRKSMLKW